jgi:hypothetical protein
MAAVTVVEKTALTYTVTITDGSSTSSHTVRVPARFSDALGCGAVPDADLVRVSFAFLLEREPPSSILRNFSLEQIGDYFPEYPVTVRRMLAAETGVGDGDGDR